MRRLTLVFALIALVSAAMRMVVPERMVQVTRIQRVFTRACQFLRSSSGRSCRWRTEYLVSEVRRRIRQPKGFEAG